MKSLNPLVTFTGGEVSPQMDSRIDLPTYRKSCRKLRNMIVTKQGGVTRRPGTQFVATGKPTTTGSNNAISRLQKFQYAPGTTFILEFGDQGIRFYSNGLQVQASSVPAWVSGTSYPYGAFVTYSGVTYYAYAGPLINDTTAPPSATNVWRPQTAYEVPSPYSAINYTAPNYWAADVFQLAFQQINDVVYIVSSSYPVWKLTRYSDTDWVMQQCQFLTPALLDQSATDTTISAAATTGNNVLLTATAPAWATATYYTPGNSVLEGGIIYNCLTIHTSGTFTTDLANGYWVETDVFAAGNLFGYYQLAYNRPQAFASLNITGNGSSSPLSIIGTWSIQTYGTWNALVTIQASYDNGVTWQVITTLTSAADANYNIAGQELTGALYQLVVSGWVTETSATIPRVIITADNQFVYGLVQIVVGSGLTPYTAYCNIITPLYSTAPTTFWSEGAWSSRRGYPQAVTVFQERVWYASSTFEPQRVWATQSDNIENFALLDQTQATYGLAFDLNAAGRGPIQWLAAQTDLFAGLAGAEWIITSGAQTAAITATAIIALEHSVNGSAPNLPGQIIGNAAFYVQRRGSNFQQMLFSVFTNKYMSQDMQVLSEHLTSAGIQQFDYQQQFENQSILWAVCGDGSLISMNYAMDQEVFAWSKHNTGDANDFGFLSVQVIYGASGEDDEVWVSVLRAGAAFCTIERIYPTDWQTTALGQPNLKEMWYADCGVSVTSPGSNVIAGLPTLLQGKVGCASIVPASGSGAWSVDNLTISNTGTVTLPNYVPTTGDVVVIGLPIYWIVQPMRLDLDPRAGEVPAIKKAISKLYLRLLNSIGGTWAVYYQGALKAFAIPSYPITENSNLPPPFIPNIPQDIGLEVAGMTEYDKDPQFLIQGNSALPFTLLGVTVDYDLEVKR